MNQASGVRSARVCAHHRPFPHQIMRERRGRWPSVCSAPGAEALAQGIECGVVGDYVHLAGGQPL
jgi:hypothetical protein